MILNGFPGYKQSGTFWENAPLKGEFTNFDNIISNKAPRWYSNMLEGLRIWSPLTGVIVF